MAAPSPAGKLVLEPNIPVEIAIKYPTPKIYPSQYEGSPDQAMFSLIDGRVIFLPVSVANDIEALQLGTREPFVICKYWKGPKESPRIVVSLTPEGEKARAITEANGPVLMRGKPETGGVRPPSPVPAAPNTITSSVQPALDTLKHSNGIPNPHVQIHDARPGSRLECALKDVVAAVQATNEYAKSIGYAMPQFNGDEICRMVNTLLIGNRNGGQ